MRRKTLQTLVKHPNLTKITCLLTLVETTTHIHFEPATKSFFTMDQLDHQPIIEDPKTEFEELGKWIEDLEKQDEDLKKQNEDLLHQNEELKLQNEQLTLQNEDLTRQEEDLRRQNEELEKHNKELKHRNEDLEKQNEELRHQHEELTKPIDQGPPAERETKQWLDIFEEDELEPPTTPSTRTFPRQSIGQWSVERMKNNMSVRTMVSSMERKRR